MSTLKPFGTFPTPYGVSVPVYRPDVIDPADPERVLFSMDATAICAGIHDQAERASFAADAKRFGRMPDPEGYGGHNLPKTPLLKPRSPAYPRLAGIGAATPIEAWTTGVMDRLRWCDRAEFLVGIIGENMEAYGSDNDLVAEVYPIGVSILLTAALEHLCEPEIDCVEAAALYALTEHYVWRIAGLAWLGPFKETWFADWRDARPRYARFARALAKAWELPDWLGERT